MNFIFEKYKKAPKNALWAFWKSAKKRASLNEPSFWGKKRWSLGALSLSAFNNTVKEGILPRLTRELDIIFNQSIHSCEDPTIMNLNTSTWPWFTPCYAISTWLLHSVIIFSRFQTSYTPLKYTHTHLQTIGFEFMVSTPWRLPFIIRPRYQLVFSLGSNPTILCTY